MRVADGPKVAESRKALALVIVVLAAAAGVWFSQEGLQTTEVFPTSAPGVQQTSELADKDAFGPLGPPRWGEVLQRREAGAPSDFSVVPKEAEPVRDMLQAVRRRDLVALRDLYSPALQRRIQKWGWSNYADGMAAILTQRFGGVDPTAYGYSFLGSGERGVVKLYRSDHGTAPGEMRVVRDGERWLLDEW
jgi:hypothetical protein